MNQALVSVVTPFHNTAQYLGHCIESVLAQTYPQFEYILVDNCSTDGAGDIAESYAQRDSRIRVIHRSRLISQVQNYNAALSEISPDSKYCKIVQADDSIFADCIRLMVQAFEQSPTIGLVSSYWLKGSMICGSGLPYQVTMLPGSEMARRYLQDGIYIFGSPTAVMYRSSIVRQQVPFFSEALLHEDTEKCMQLLLEWDFGFVHQVLSFLRLGNESISSAVRTFHPQILDWYIMIQRYAPLFLEPEVAFALRKHSKRQYYSVLAEDMLRFRGRDFWKYHETGLKTLGESLDWSYLILQITVQLFHMLANPGTTLTRLVHYLARKNNADTNSAHVAALPQTHQSKSK